MHFVIIGHLTRDITDDGYTIGGAVSYSGVTARRMGADVTVLTRAHPADVQILEAEGIQVINLPTDIYTTFRNIYHRHIRTQQLLAVAAPIMAHQVPPHLFEADLILLAPVAQEVDPDIAAKPHRYLAATPQGWMREWDTRGRVYPVPWHSAGRILPHLNAIIFSEHDMAGDPAILPTIIETVPLVAITRAAQGCVIYHQGRRYQIPTRPAHEIDATGAGDTFTAAFLVEIMNGTPPPQAAYFANVAASLSIEAIGLAGIPYRHQVASYIETHPLP